MTAPVVIVHPSDEGMEAHWFRGEHEALHSAAMASATSLGVWIDGAPEDVAALAYQVHGQLAADRSADVSWVATHRRVVDGLGVELVTLERPVEPEPRHADPEPESVPASLRRLMDANEKLVDDRARLTREVEVLLWLHAERGWLLKVAGEGWARATDKANEWGQIRHQHWLAAKRLRGELAVALGQRDNFSDGLKLSTEALEQVRDAAGLASDATLPELVDTVRGMQDRIDQLRGEAVTRG